ncbi:MAG: outer membrane beta-barrel protein [Alphaproteobacteria bacterium]
MKYRLFSICAFTALSLPVCTISAQTASLAEREQELSVLTRRNPDYDPAGTRFAGFIFHADLDNVIEHTDNLYSTQSDEIADTLHIVRPAIEVRSDFSRHFFSASLTAENGRYVDIEDENYFDYSASINGRVDISRDITAPLSVSYNRGHSRRSSPDDRGVVEPTKNNELNIGAGLDYKGATIDASLSNSFKRNTFEDNRTETAFVNNNDRNRNQFGTSATIGLSRELPLSPFLYTGFQKIRYDQKIDDNGFERSSQSFITGLGLNLTPSSSLLRSTVRAAYVRRNLDDNRFDSINDFLYALNLTWEPSTLMALTLNAERSIEESTLNNISSSIDTKISASAVYEFAPNIFIEPSASYLLRDYKGNADRDLKRMGAEMELLYKLNRNLWVSGQYEYIKQTEHQNSVEVNDFDRNIYNLSVKLQL